MLAMWRYGCAVAFLAGAAVAAVPGPPRSLTEPGSVVSAVNPAAKRVSVSDLFQIRSAGGATLTPDGKTLVFSANISGRFNLWKVEMAGGEPVPLAKSNERQYGPVASPDGREVLFTSDVGGNEQFDIYAVPVTGGEPVDLTQTPDVSESEPVFSADGRTVAFARKPKTESHTDIWVMDMVSHAVRALTQEASLSEQWQPVAFTADGHFVIANRGDTNQTHSGVWKIDVTSGKAERIGPVDDAHLFSASDISRDGGLLAFSSNLTSPQQQAGVLDLKSGKLRWLAPDAWEQNPVAFSPDGRTLLYTVNADGRTTLYLYDMATGRHRPLSFPPGLSAALGQQPFTADGRHVLVGHQASNAPADYWLAPTSLGGRSSQITHLAPSTVDVAALPSSQIVHYASHDGTVISAILMVPFNLKRDGSAPGVVLPHGGPTGQTVDSFNRTMLALASRGYLVIAPNVRGSTGYGKPFQDANLKDLGGGDLIDEVYGAKFLTATGYVDPKRIGITGGSYGGFMTLMAIGKTPDIWAAAVEQYGIINWYAMLQHEEPSLQQYERGLIGDPVKDKAIYDATSPMTYIRKAKAPLLVLQGENDIRVPKGQAEEVVATLKANGNVVDAVYYPHEGHGFARRENQIDALQRTAEWFEKYLKPSQ